MDREFNALADDGFHVITQMESAQDRYALGYRRVDGSTPAYQSVAVKRDRRTTVQQR